MKIFNRKSQAIEVFTYNVADTVYLFPFRPPTRVEAGQEGYVQAHDNGQCKLRVRNASGDEVLRPGWVFSESDNLCLRNPRGPSADREEPAEAGGPDPELAKFLRDNAELVYFTDGFGNFLPR